MNYQNLTSRDLWLEINNNYSRCSSIDPYYICAHSSAFVNLWHTLKAKPIIINLAKMFLAEHDEVKSLLVDKSLQNTFTIGNDHSLFNAKCPTTVSGYIAIRKEFLSWMTFKGYELAHLFFPEFWAEVHRSYTQDSNFYICPSSKLFAALWNLSAGCEYIKTHATEFLFINKIKHISIHASNNYLFWRDVEFVEDDTLRKIKLNFLKWMHQKNIN